MPDCLRRYVKGEIDEVPGPIFRPNGASLLMSSRISCIRLGPKRSSHAVNGDPNVGHALYPLFFIGLLFYCSIIHLKVILFSKLFVIVNMYS